MSTFAPSIENARRDGVKIVRQEYPTGVAGVRLSLQQIAQRIREGANDKDVQGVAFDALIKAGFQGRGAAAGGAFARASALLTFVRSTVLYAPDPPGVEHMKSAAAMLCLRPGLCIRGGDCFPKATILLRRNGEPADPGPFAKLERVFIEDVREGDEIWGWDAWTTVRRQWATGKKVLDRIFLDTGEGSVEDEHGFDLSPEHHIFVQCLRAAGTPYSGPLGRHSFGPLERVRLANFKPGQNSWLPRPRARREGMPIRVKRVERGVDRVECFDITTSDGFVYLPEHDVTVSNCDDNLILLGSLVMGVGIPVKVLKQTFGPGDQEHVLLEAQDDNGTWFALDPSTDLPAGRKARASSEFRLDPTNPSTIGLTGAPEAEFIGVGSTNLRFVGDVAPSSFWTPTNTALAIVAGGVVVGAAVGLAQRARRRR